MFNPRSIFNSLRRQTSPTSAVSLANTTKANQTKPSSLTPLQQQILERVETCYQQAEAYFNRSFSRPLTQFSLRGKSAGTAHLHQNRLRFNPVLLQENSEAFLTEVVPHEISHLLCFQLCGRTKPHGPEWQNIMWRVFSVPPRTTHSFDTQSVKGQEIEYRCHCGPINLSIRRHNKVLRKETHYRCKRCKQTLTQVTSE